MPTCTLWRYLPGKPGASTLPGKSAESWRPCREPVSAGITGCADCFEALIQHPDSQVRIAAATHPDVPADVLAVLALDGDHKVAIAAADAIHQRAITSDSTSPSTAAPAGALRP
ncbi:hypothetical protein [Pseudoclavibacter sp. VKM Ac-2888]|uniref:hypothetical protein n=1 Tax=Pseudoclavibacter sp. VKM Ac-2888 TaxID=2783830 RepID=UPI00188B96BD|nr:hypothetical protein [Pseudoclavibacter sp. VKM Ac-2888]MBF4549456.1 hypothetical protein [Pseudoclavibacter sp. VKM Ac-2888]